MSSAQPRQASEERPGSALPGRVLLVDDEPLVLRALARILEDQGHRTESAESARQALAALAQPDLDVVLLDLGLGEDDGLELLERVKREQPEVEVVVVTGNASIQSAVECIRRGALDYVAKPFDPHRVRSTVRMAVERRRLVRRNRELEARLQGEPSLLGRSESMQRLRRRIASLRHNESTVLVTGESGTGKELVARALHAQSPRAGRRFVPVDCGALPQTILESELFGHERGAFTGATGAPGLFRVASGGTLFLDEVGELPASAQVRLLRALQEREVRPLGSSQPVPVDLRVIAATHRDLGRLAEEGAFRSDLLYRLDVVRVEIPPLRERREDIPELVLHFAAKHARPGHPVEGVDDDALAWLCERPWPGNVRELENAVESALAMAAGPRLGRADLQRGPCVTAAPSEPRTAALDALPLSLEAYERAALLRALEESGGDVRVAAAALGVGRSTFYRKLAQQGLSTRT